VQVLLNGIVSGLTIAILALAFGVVYLPTRVFHLALAGIHAFVPYIVWTLVKSGAGWPVAIAGGVLTAVLLSGACEVLNHRRLQVAGASTSVHLLSSLAIYILLSQAAAILWGNDPKTLRATADEAYPFAGLVLTRSQIIEAAVALALLGVAAWLFRRTSLGLQFRGLADNSTEMVLRGYDVWQLRLFAFTLSGVLCVGSAIPLALDYGFDPNSGLSTLLLALVAVMIGGRASFAGPVAGGLLLGIVRSQVVWTLSARWQEAASFALLGIVMLFRPAGLLGSLGRLEARE
jgi:branched-chain amino acid transport system permease protein